VYSVLYWNHQTTEPKGHKPELLSVPESVTGMTETQGEAMTLDRINRIAAAAIVGFATGFSAILAIIV